jgi:hypothetical protein
VLSEEQQAEVNSILDELLDMPESLRAQRLHSRRVTDSAVLAEVESLLGAANASTDFLSSPAFVGPALHGGPEGFAETLSLGTRLGVWRITGRIGRGGMGEVYEARRTEGDFEQRVAIKVLQQEATAQLERFRAERQILARMEHPGIARLYDGGISPEGRPYMVMEFVEGQIITDYCAATGASLQRRLELFIRVCEAVAYAHRNLVVHRDLKPSNILVTSAGEIKLLDFGIAKPIDALRAELTAATMAPLTPGSAAPEQLTGAPITTATDVYGLGVLLFELLTGQHPFITADTPILQALHAILQRPAPIPSRAAALRSDAPVAPRLLCGDLDAIVAKSLRTEPARRYATVDELKSDVRRAMRGEPVGAREGARLYVFGRLVRRYRWAAVSAVAVFLSLAGGLGAAAWQARRVAIERDIASRDASREEAIRYNLTQLFRSAIADQGAQPATAKAMIDSSAQRVLSEYRDQPQLAGQIVLTLADLYGALEDVAGARALLEGFVSGARPEADPATLADARQKLANIELLSGHPERAGTLLDQAAAFWAQAPRQYAEERLEGLGIRARLQRSQGNIEGSIATSREAIVERTALSGHDHRETAILYNSLAISLTAANQLEEALGAYRETTAIYRAIGLGDGLDAQIVVGNTGTLALRTGHLPEAESLLKSAIERERSLAGDSAAVAAAMGYYGKLLSVTNRNASAVPVLHDAVDLATRFAGPKSPVALQNELFLGEAELAADIDAARSTLIAAHNAALAQFGPTHLLGAVIAALRQSAPPSDLTLAQALQALGEVQLTQNPNTAVAALRESLALREKVRQEGYQVAIARERLGEALCGGADTQQGAALLKEAAQSLQSQLGIDHPQTARASAASAHCMNKSARAV